MSEKKMVNEPRMYTGVCKDNGERLFGYLFKHWGRCFLLWGMTNGYPTSKEIIPETVAQATGEVDRHNNEMYEGHRCVLRNVPIDPFESEETIDVIAEVRFICGGFHFWNKEGCCEPIGDKPGAWEILGYAADLDKNKPEEKTACFRCGSSKLPCSCQN